MQVALGVADGGVLLFDIVAAAVTARLSAFRGDVQSLAWARFRCPASGQQPAADSGNGGGSSVSAAPGLDAPGAAAAASEHSDAAQQAGARLKGHGVTPVLTAEGATDAAQQPADLPPKDAAGIAAVSPSGGVCDLLAAGARDGSIQIWDCRCARICRQRPCIRLHHLFNLVCGLASQSAGC